MKKNRPNNSFSFSLVMFGENNFCKAQTEQYQNRLKIIFPHFLSRWVSSLSLVVGLLAKLCHRYPHSYSLKMLQNVLLVSVHVPSHFLSFKRGSLTVALTRLASLLSMLLAHYRDRSFKQVRALISV